jgi:hypothetical protein
MQPPPTPMQATPCEQDVAPCVCGDAHLHTRKRNPLNELLRAPVQGVHIDTLAADSPQLKAIGGRWHTDDSLLQALLVLQGNIFKIVTKKG